MSGLALPTTTPDHQVGLWPEQPFSFCTYHHGAANWRFLFHSDLVTRKGFGPLPMEGFMADRGRIVKPHRHDFFEIALVRGGRAVHRIQNGFHEAQRGDVIIIPPGAVHSYEAIQKLLLTNFYLQAEWFTDYLRLLWHEGGLVHDLLPGGQADGVARNQIRVLQIGATQMRQCEAELRRILAEARRPRPSLLMYLASFQRIFHVWNQTVLEDAPQPQPRYDPRVGKALREIEQIVNRGDVFNVRALAEQFQMSRTYFTQIFRPVVGCPPETYYQQRRIHVAMRLLKQSDLPLSDIACQLGFYDQAYFTRIFKSVTGKTPRQYRYGTEPSPHPHGGGLTA